MKVRWHYINILMCKAKITNCKRGKIIFFKKNTRKTCTFQIKVIPLHSQFGNHSSQCNTGEMVEWSITAVLKTAVLRGTGGSNPSLSALRTATAMLQFFYSNISRNSHIYIVDLSQWNKLLFKIYYLFNTYMRNFTYFCIIFMRQGHYMPANI